MKATREHLLGFCSNAILLINSVEEEYLWPFHLSHLSWKKLDFQPNPFTRTQLFILIKPHGKYIKQEKNVFWWTETLYPQEWQQPQEKLRAGCFWSHLIFSQVLKHGNTTMHCFRVTQVQLTNGPISALILGAWGDVWRRKMSQNP